MNDISDTGGPKKEVNWAWTGNNKPDSNYMCVCGIMATKSYFMSYSTILCAHKCRITATPPT